MLEFYSDESFLEGSWSISIYWMRVTTWADKLGYLQNAEGNTKFSMSGTFPAISLQ